MLRIKTKEAGSWYIGAVAGVCVLVTTLLTVSPLKSLWWVVVVATLATFVGVSLFALLIITKYVAYKLRPIYSMVLSRDVHTAEMLGELNGSHTGARYSYRSGLNMGSLGAFYDNTYEGDGLKIAEIIKGGALYLQHPEIKAGDIITAVNGQPIVAGEDWSSLLKGKGGQKVVITVKQKGKKEQDIFIEPAFTDYTQLYNRWVDQRAQMVKELSGGRIGYVHVEGMDSESFRRVYSDLLGKYRTCEAVIVDTRHNGGGWLHDDLATLLAGVGYIRFEPRGQYIGTEPYSKWTKPSCVLIGEDNYSDASGFP